MADYNAGMNDAFVAHEIRITSHGKMQAWVEFALKFFEENPEKPLTFHTLPASPVPKTGEAAESATQGGSHVATAAAKSEDKKTERMHPSMALIPRLVSVVEIIKREYVKMLDPALAENGALQGLHQYNELGELTMPSLQDEGESQAATEERQEMERREKLMEALQGKNHLKMKKIAYMKITLCRKQISATLNKPHTYQKPTVRKLSKSARTRAKKRLQKEAAAANQGDS